MRNCLLSFIASSVRDGLRMLNVIMGEGVRVRVVKDETVMPRNAAVSDEPAVLVVATTTECGILRISSRSCVDSLGSPFPSSRLTC